MAHSLPRLALPLVLFVPSIARSVSAAPDWVPIAETPSCRVALTKVSYDGPGADDVEFIELMVERFRLNEGAPPRPKAPGTSAPDADAPAPACHGGADAGASTDAAVTDARSDAPAGALTLGDCGLEELRLVNGGGGACDEYRVIPLASVVVPSDGFVVVCAEDSALGACDVTTAGRSALKNGFLQNGPNDGLRFVERSGAFSLEVRYEGGPACFSPAAVKLVDETGELAGATGVDDVNVACDGQFELRSATDALLRRPNPCGATESDAGGTGGATAVAAPTTNVPPPEFAPDGGVGYPFPLSFPDGAAPTATSKPSGALPAPPGCVTSSGRAPVGRDARWLLAAPLAAFGLRRRRRRAPLPRAGCSARCASAPRRSP